MAEDPIPLLKASCPSSSLSATPTSGGEKLSWLQYFLTRGRECPSLQENVGGRRAPTPTQARPGGKYPLGALLWGIYKHFKHDICK